MILLSRPPRLTSRRLTVFSADVHDSILNQKYRPVHPVFAQCVCAKALPIRSFVAGQFLRSFPRYETGCATVPKPATMLFMLFGDFAVIGQLGPRRCSS